MYSFTKREQVAILVIVFIIISIFGYKFILEDSLNKKDEEFEILGIKSQNILVEDREDLEEESFEDTIIMVHISGEVYRPGIITMLPGERVNDAVRLAGGLKKDADIDRINLSKKVVDEEKIYIPKIGEEGDLINIIEETSNSKEINGKIDINNCSRELLISLPGVGEVTADKIISYRNEFRFEKIEDIMQVSGIGDKKFQAIKDLIIVK